MAADTKKLGWPVWVASALLFLYFAVHLWFASQGKEFWMDETDGVYYNLKHDLWFLFLEGSDGGQGSRSPLVYILDRIWFYLWGDIPQEYWDLRLFFRVLPVTYWSGVHVFLFVHLWRYFFTEKNFGYWIAALVSLAIAQFSYSNNFGSYYAIETRAYSLWVACSFLQFLALWQVLRSQDRAGWALYFWSSCGLVFTSYASLPQIFIGGGILLLDQWVSERKISFLGERPVKVMLTLVVGAFIGFYYFANANQMNYKPASTNLYWTSVLEVLLKSFHHHSYHAAYVTFPLLFVLIPLYWFRRDRIFTWLNLYSLALLANTYVLYLASLKKGGIYASRYVIYLLPHLTFLYVLGIATILYGLSKWLEKRTGKVWATRVFVILCVIELPSRSTNIYKGTPKDVERFFARNSFGRRAGPDCTVPLPHNPWDVELVSNNCRGFTAELPKNPFTANPGKSQ